MRKRAKDEQTGLSATMADMLRRMPDDFVRFEILRETHGVAVSRPTSLTYSALAARGLVESRRDGMAYLGRRTAAGRALLRR